MIQADGFKDALVGIGVRCGQDDILVYDVDKCVEILMEKDNMSFEEATEYLEFNAIGAWAGNQTPVWLYKTDEVLYD